MQRVTTTIRFFVLAALLVPATARAQASEFFFFSPDFGPGNLSGLTEAAEDYFKDASTKVGFQPFARIEDFEREFAVRQPAFVVVPERVVLARCLRTQLRPLAFPVRGDRNFGRRSLMARAGVDSVTALTNGSVAASLPAGDETIRSAAISQLKHDVPGIRIIPVPKDVDALLAVGFGQVDAAFVSDAQFDQLAKINPRLTDTLNELGYNEEIPFPMVYATEFASEQNIDNLRALMQTVNDTESGKRLSALLGYDGWNLVDPEQSQPIRLPDQCNDSNEEKEGSS
jgi:hypothetical protein